MIELIKEILFGVNDPNTHQAFLPAAMAIGGIAQMAMGFDWGGKRRKALGNARTAYDNQKTVFKGLDTSNAFGDLKNEYSGMENTMEDLTVNTQQAEFEKNMFQQSQANTLDTLRQSAGGSGVAALAQVMSSQAITQAQKTSASIGKQEARNKLLSAQQAQKNLQLEAKGASDVGVYKAKGKLSSMQMEQSKQSTLLGMDAQAVTGAQGAVQAGKQMMASGASSLIGGAAAAYTPSVGVKGEEGFVKAGMNFFK
tara:strand:+ start:507 stop:1268 length:762 start_codon:yes stop_codon:yes gene_type:complete